MSAIVLTSCSSILDIFNSQKEPEIRTTATEYEMQKILYIKNYTLRLFDGEVVEEYHVADNKKLFVASGIEIINDYDVNALNGIYYKTEYGWSGSVTDTGWDANELMIGNMLSLSLTFFNDAIYDETEKCYFIEKELSGDRIWTKFYFEDGKPIKISVGECVDGIEKRAEFTNIGSTTIDVSNLHINNDGKVESGNPDETIRTTVTQSEFESAMNMKNVSARVLDSGLGALYKFTEDGLWIFDLHHDYLFDEDSETFAVKIDDEYFLLENTDGKYVLGKSADDLIFALIPGVNIEFADAVYSEEERYYEVELEADDNFDTSRAYLYFENGALLKIAVVKCVMAFHNGAAEPTPQYYEWLMFLSDCGTTTIDFPKYEITK